MPDVCSIILVDADTISLVDANTIELDCDNGEPGCMTLTIADLGTITLAIEDC